MPTLVVGPDRIDWTLRVSDRARRMRIIVRPAGVEVVVPAGAPLHGPRSAHAFVAAKAEWLRRAVREVADRAAAAAAAPPAAACVDGALVWWRGEPHHLAIAPADDWAAAIDHDVPRRRITVALGRSGDAAALEPAVRTALAAWLGEATLADARRWSDHYGARLGRSAADVRLTSARRRWGSCAPGGVVRVHWRLAQAPAVALSYVVAHEIAHLAVPNHSPRFWDTVERIMPGHAAARAALREWERAMGAAGWLP